MDLTRTPQHLGEARTNGIPHGIPNGVPHFNLHPAEARILAEQEHSPPAPTPTPVNGVHHTPAFRRPAAVRRARYVCRSCSAGWPSALRSCLFCGGELRHSFYNWQHMGRYTSPRVRYLHDGRSRLVNGGEYDRLEVVDDESSDMPMLQPLGLRNGSRGGEFNNDSNEASLENFSDAETRVEGEEYDDHDGHGQEEEEDNARNHQEAVTITVTITSGGNPPARRRAEEDMGMGGSSADVDDEVRANQDENMEDRDRNLNGNIQSNGFRLGFRRN